jgi:hypothetical protein
MPRLTKEQVKAKAKLAADREQLEKEKAEFEAQKLAAPAVVNNVVAAAKPKAKKGEFTELYHVVKFHPRREAIDPKLVPVDNNGDAVRFERDVPVPIKESHLRIFLDEAVSPNWVDDPETPGRMKVGGFFPRYPLTTLHTNIGKDKYNELRQLSIQKGAPKLTEQQVRNILTADAQ